MSTPAHSVHRGRRTLLLLAAVFLGPMAIAMTLWLTGFQWRPSGTTEHGVLYRPARPLPDAALRIVGPADAAAQPQAASTRDAGTSTASLNGKWTLIYIGAGNCDERCREALIEMRQVRRALGRDMERVQRLYVVTGAATSDDAFLAREHPGIGVLGPGPEADGIAARAGAAAPGEIFLADPLGNLVMRYAAGTGMKGIHEDLKHLLKISTIG